MKVARTVGYFCKSASTVIELCMCKMTGSVSLNIFQLDIMKIEACHCSDFSGEIKHIATLDATPETLYEVKSPENKKI
jgi:hypothetical protein